MLHPDLEDYSRDQFDQRTDLVHLQTLPHGRGSSTHSYRTPPEMESSRELGTADLPCTYQDLEHRFEQQSPMVSRA